MTDKRIESSKKRNDDVSLGGIVKVFIPKIWIIGLCAVVLGLLLGGYAMLFKAETYTSNSTFIVSTTTGGITDGDLKLSYKVIGVIEESSVGSTDFLKNVADTINTQYAEKGYKVTAQELKRSVKMANNNEDVPSFSITVTTEDPNKSRDIAYVLRDYMLVDSVDDVKRVQDFMPAAYSKVTMTCIDSPELGTASSRGILKNAIVGFLAGAVISMVVIYMIAMFDVVIHDRKKLEDHFDIPILGVIPRYEGAPSDAEKGGAEE